MAYMSQEKKKALEPAVKAILAKHGLKGRLGVHHHSTLVLNIFSGPIDFIGSVIKNEHGHGYTNPDYVPDHLQVNVYHIESHFKGKACEVLSALKKAMMVGNHDRSDSMADYFDVGWYVDINIGKWDRPYQLTK